MDELSFWLEDPPAASLEISPYQPLQWPFWVIGRVIRGVLIKGYQPAFKNKIKPRSVPLAHFPGRGTPITVDFEHQRDSTPHAVGKRRGVMHC